jgi:hypothetical protein
MSVKLSRTSRWWAAGLAVTLLAVSTIIAFSSDTNHAQNSGPSMLFGTLDTQASTAQTEKKDGISVAMFELNWASFEPSEGVFSASYMATMRSYLQAFRKAGMRVTLGLGLENTPSWVLALPDGRYVNQDGDSSAEADFVFSAAVRQAAAAYLAKVAADLPLSDFWAIRLTSGGDDEMLYPPGGTYWAFGSAALTGAGLPATMTPNPFPDWRPGRPGLTAAQIDRWVNWDVGGLDNVTNWLLSAGHSGFGNSSRCSERGRTATPAGWDHGRRGSLESLLRAAAR